MMAKPEKAHEWLHQLVGEWAYEHEMPAEPGTDPVRFTGTETVRSVGGLWVVAEGRGEMPGGGAATMVLTLGYDPQKGKYVGTWYGSMMTYLWVYEGALDPAGTSLTLETDGPNCMGDGATAHFRETIALTPDGGRTFASAVRGADGTYKTLMTARYRRVR